MKNLPRSFNLLRSFFLLRSFYPIALISSFALFPSFTFAQDSAGTGSLLASLDTAFARALKEEHAPGFAVAVVKGDKIVYSRGFGYRDYEHHLPVTPNTLFAIASCTKAFTSALIGMQPPNRKVALDSPIRHYLPELQFYNNTMNERITVRDMLCHRTGLPRHDASWNIFYTPSQSELLSRVQYQQPTADVHERFQYNNLMFVALGALAEKLNGVTWEERIRKEIFLPLGMSHSTTSFNEWIHAPEAAFGYSVKNDSLIHKQPFKDCGALNPAGGIVSCVSDMARWLLLWIHGGRIGDLRLIPADYVTEAISPQMVIPGGLPTKERPDVYISNYGLGWFVGSYRGHYRVTHDGQIAGFTSGVTFFPSDSLGIVVLCNQQTSNIPNVVRNLIVDKMFGLPWFDWQTDVQKISDQQSGWFKLGRKFARVNRIPNTSPSHPLHEYEGVFENKGYGRLRVENRHDSLYAVMPAYTVWLRHFHYDIFETMDDLPGEAIDTSGFGLPHLQFNTGDKGHITDLSIQFETSLPPVLFTRAPDLSGPSGLRP